MTVPRLSLVTAASESPTTELLQVACQARGVELEAVEALTFDFLAPREPRPVELVYCAMTDPASIRVEQALLVPGAVSFHASSEDALFLCINQPALLARHGIPTPRTVPVATTDRDLLKRYIERLGGFPLVLKVPGGSYGIGVMRVDSLPSLLSLVDYLHHIGAAAFLCQYVAHQAQYRLFVVGQRVVCALRQTPGPDDFRTNRPGRSFEEAKGKAVDLEALGALAVQSCQAARVEFGGVDILIDEGGQPVVTEVNFPTYFQRAQDLTHADIAGAMVDHLLAKAAARS